MGSNSIGTTKASIILVQVEEIVDLLRRTYSHLTNCASISISYTFPCFKPSSQYPTCYLLLSNIRPYNEGVHTLSLRKEFSIVNFPIAGEHLSPDGLHIRTDYLFVLYDNIHKYFTGLLKLTSTTPNVKRRSRAAVTQRNTRRHKKFKINQATYTLVRTIARVWHLQDLKQYLKHKNIHFNRLTEIRHHQLRIQFNHFHHLPHAEQSVLPMDFGEQNCYKWILKQLT